MDFLLTGELADLSSGFGLEAVGNIIIQIQDSFTEGILMKDNIFLSVNIFLHILMNVKMIRR